MEQENASILDLRGLKCPLPVLKARKAMKPLAAGSRIWLETTDPLAAIDIPAFCNENGHELLATEDCGEYQRFLLSKGD